MYKPENLLPEDVLNEIEITPNVKALVKIFSKKIDLNCVSTRGARRLKSAGCETIGDVYYFMLDHVDDIGYRTAIKILFYILGMLLPCGSVGECEKAFLLSQNSAEQPDEEQPSDEIPEDCPNHGITDYDLMRFRFHPRNIRCSTGKLAELLHMDRIEFEAAVMRGMEEEAKRLGKE